MGIVFNTFSEMLWIGMKLRMSQLFNLYSNGYLFFYNRISDLLFIDLFSILYFSLFIFIKQVFFFSPYLLIPPSILDPSYNQ